MNPMTHFKKIRILPLLIALALVALTAVPARATTACNFSGTQLAMGTFPEGLLDLMCKDLPGWDLKFKVKGDTDVYVFQNTWQPLGHTASWAQPALRCVWTDHGLRCVRSLLHAHYLLSRAG